MERKPEREPYERPELTRHGSLEELTGQQKGTQGATDKSSIATDS